MVESRFAAKLSIYGNRLKEELPGVLSEVHKIGYRFVECGMDLFKDGLDEKVNIFNHSGIGICGVHFVARHINEQFISQSMNYIDVCNKVGAKDLILSSEVKSFNKDILDVLECFGSKARETGVRFFYHNHAHEFEDTENGIEFLAQNLDKEKIMLAVDLGWVFRSGVEPADFLFKHKEKIGYIHLKDFKGSDYIEVGFGDVDFLKIEQVIKVIPWIEWLVIEQDKTLKTVKESMSISLNYAKNIFKDVKL